MWQAQKGELEVFVSREGHVTDWHTDFMENFTVQIRQRTHKCAMSRANCCSLISFVAD